MVEKLKQLVAAYQDEFARLKRDLEAAENARDDRRTTIIGIQAQMQVVRAHAIQLQGVIEGEAGEWVELVKSFG